MLKLLKYLKKSIFSILIIVILLILQATCDLSLPEYTSKIVNIGIQQGGVEETALRVARESTLDKLFLFMSDSDKETVLRSYAPIDHSTLTEEAWNNYLKQYPVLEREVIYERNTDEKEIIAQLEGIMEKPLLIVSQMGSGSEQTKALEEQLKANLPPELADTATDIYQLLGLLPAETISQIAGAIDQQLDAMPESIIKQSAIVQVRAEYEAIGIDIDGGQSRYILTAGAKMLGIALLSMIASILVGFFAARVAAALGMDLRGRVFGKVVSFSSKELNQFSTASLITRSTNDIQQIQLLMTMMLRIVFYAPILGIGGVIKVLGTDTSMGWIIAVAVMAILSLVLVLFGLAMPKFKSMQKLVDKLNLVTREILTGLPVIRAFSTQKHEEGRFDLANINLTKTNLFVNRAMAGMMPAMMLIMNAITLLIVWNGGHAVDSGAMQVGDMMAFIQYTMQIIMAFLMVSMVSIMLPRASVSATRIEEVLSADESIRDPEEPMPFDPEKKGLVEFRDVSFHYSNAEECVLSHISFTARPGEMTAFIGSTGSGKSTLLNLIPRFFDVTEGEIFVDGTDVRKVTQHDLHEKLGYVPQQGVLFSGTIESNLKYGKNDATEEEIEHAARIAQASDFIEEKPERYQTAISQGGINVSGGQKQRLSIARAVAINPEIYLFDDSFSALDFKTEGQLRRALRSETKRSTVLIVAQRINTIMNADQIIVLDEGKIFGKGTHRELMETSEVYRQIATSQLSKEELA